MYWKLQIGFDIFSTIFKLVGSTNLEYDYFEIFKYIWIFECICEYFYKQYSYYYLWHNLSTIIFIFIFIEYVVCEYYSYSYLIIRKIIFFTLRLPYCHRLQMLAAVQKSCLYQLTPYGWPGISNQGRVDYGKIEFWGSFAAHLHIIQIST